MHPQTFSTPAPSSGFKVEVQVNNDIFSSTTTPHHTPPHSTPPLQPQLPTHTFTSPKMPSQNQRVAVVQSSAYSGSSTGYVKAMYRELTSAENASVVRSVALFGVSYRTLPTSTLHHETLGLLGSGCGTNAAALRARRWMDGWWHGRLSLLGPLHVFFFIVMFSRLRMVLLISYLFIILHHI